MKKRLWTAGWTAVFCLLLSVGCGLGNSRRAEDPVSRLPEKISAVRAVYADGGQAVVRGQRKPDSFEEDQGILPAACRGGSVQRVLQASGRTGEGAVQGYPQTERPGPQAAAVKHFCPDLGYPAAACRGGIPGPDQRSPMTSGWMGGAPSPDLGYPLKTESKIAGSSGRLAADRAGETDAGPQAGEADGLPASVSARGTKASSQKQKVTVQRSKGKLKKAAKKSRAVTRKITTRRKRSSVKNGAVILKETTTVREKTTVYKKGSRVTDITVRVTRSVRTSAEPIRIREADIRKAAAEADARLLRRFADEGYRYVIDTGLAYTGLFSSRGRQITMRGKNDVVYHELGHYLAFTTGNTDLTPEWAAVYKKESPYFDGENKEYVTSSCREYFAETYRDYVTRQSRLRRTRPQSYAYMEKVLAML